MNGNLAEVETIDRDGSLDLVRVNQLLSVLTRKKQLLEQVHVLSCHSHFTN